MAIKIRGIYDPGSPEKSIDRLEKELKKLKPGEPYRVYVMDLKQPRTLPQNAYYWGVVLKYICEDTGNDPKAMHQHFLKEYAPEAVIIKGKIDIVPGSSATMDKKDFSLFVDQIKLWAAEFLNIRIPEPNEVPDEVYLEMLDKGYIK